jgi:hypothetical protein
LAYDIVNRNGIDHHAVDPTTAVALNTRGNTDLLTIFLDGLSMTSVKGSPIIATTAIKKSRGGFIHA